jgi:hypothetical protein
MKRVLLAILALALLPATASAAPTTTGTLYVQQAANAQLVRSGNAWKLVLDRPDAHVIAFADRPARTGTAQRLSTFVRGWDAAFGGDPPNAALQDEGAPPSRDIALLELSAPRLSKGGHRLTYRARPLTATSATLGGLAKRADRGISGHLGRVTLFIDDGGATATGTLTVAVTGVPGGMLLELNPLTVGAGTPVFTTPSPYAYWGVLGGGVQITCDSRAGSATCDGTLVVPISAPPGPLTMQYALPPGSTAALTWEGTTTSLSPGGGTITLPGQAAS